MEGAVIAMQPFQGDGTLDGQVSRDTIALKQWIPALKPEPSVAAVRDSPVPAKAQSIGRIQRDHRGLHPYR